MSGAFYSIADTWNGGAAPWTSGTGAENNPFLIQSADNLSYLAVMVNNGNTYEGMYFRLTTDINLNYIDWIPIGQTNHFDGYFDGGYHTISNLYIHSTAYSNIGLFGHIMNASINNLNINGDIMVNSSTSSAMRVGGIVGFAEGSSNINNCRNACNIIGNYFQQSSVGGILGRYENFGTLSSHILINNCYNEGSVQKGNYVGGIIGKCSDNFGTTSVIIRTCVNDGVITAFARSGSVGTDGESGGIIGTSYKVNLRLIECANTDTVKSPGYHQSAKAGGLVGNVFGCDSIYIINCYNSGTIRSPLLEQNQESDIYTNSLGRVGGAVCEKASSTIVYINSYSSGELFGHTVYDIGAYGNASNSYYLSSSQPSYACGTPISESTMQSASFPLMLNIDSTVFIQDIFNINNGYPIFSSSLCSAHTLMATNVVPHGAMLHGQYTEGEYWAGNAAFVGFEYKIQGASTYTPIYLNPDSIVSYNLTGLQSNTTYEYRFFVFKNNTFIYSGSRTFHTLPCDITLNIYTNTNSTQMCEGDSLTLTGYPHSSFFGNYYNYIWSTGDTTRSIKVTNANTYQVVATDMYGCADTQSINIEVLPNPTGYITGDEHIYQGQSAALTIHTDRCYVYWSTGDRTSQITANQNGEYSCNIIQYATGCENTISHNVTVHPLPTITGTNYFCQGDSTVLTANGGDSYLWSNGSTDQSIIVADTGTYIVTAYLHNGGVPTRSATAQATVTMRSLPNVSISGDTIICSGVGTTLTASGGNSYQWNNSSNTQSIMVSDTGTYSVLVTDGFGCSRSKSINIHNIQPAVIQATNTEICANQNVGLSLINNGSSYLWSTGDTSSSISVSSSGVYTGSYSLPNGCSASANINVIVHTLPSPTIVGTTTICQGQSTTLSVIGSDSYLWSTGASSNSISVSSQGEYSVTVTDIHGCSSTASASVLVNPIPEPTITGAQSICQGDTSELVAHGGVSYLWSTGMASDTINISSAGTYTVTATNEYGCTNSTSIPVIAYSLPTIQILGNDYFCQDSTMNLTACGAMAYVWSTGSSNSSIVVGQIGQYNVVGTDSNGCSSTAVKNITMRPTYSIAVADTICENENYNFYGQNLNVPGRYSHTLTSVDGCDSIIALSLQVNPVPVVSINGDTSICQGDTVTFTAIGSGNYLWSTGASTSTIDAATTGKYIVTSTNGYGCSTKDSIFLVVHQIPVVQIVGNTEICQGDTASLIAVGADQYLWSNGSSNAGLLYNQPGIISVFGTTSFGCSASDSALIIVHPTYDSHLEAAICQGDTLTFYSQALSSSGEYSEYFQSVDGCDSAISVLLTVNPLPAASISGNSAFCAGSSTTLVVSGGVSYLWNNSDTSNTIIVSAGGIYSVTVTDSNACSIVVNDTIVMNNLPMISISGDDSFCQGESATLVAEGANTYVWSTGATTSQISVNEFGIYSVVGTDMNGCSNTASKTITMNLVPTILFVGDSVICRGDTTTIIATGADSYLWFNGSTEDSYTTSIAGYYGVIGYSDAGCQSTSGVNIYVNEPSSSEFFDSTTSIYTWNGVEYSSSGDYCQILTNSAGCDSIVTLHLTIHVGINEINYNNIIVFSNRSSIHVLHAEGNDILIYDEGGRIVAKAMNYHNSAYHCSDLHSGIYFVRIGNYPIKKVVVVR